MSLLPHGQDRVIEISEETYCHLMHELSLAGANVPTPYGSGWTASHPELGEIAVSRVKRPARHREHPPFAFYVESFSDEGFEKVKAAVQ